ncbi:recombinase family protein [Curtobacterium sp. PhB115]|uniref:recombinase family protein n=1 Tax=Curtobacterium sp. PhB115 TaxID=2485173 RepID=UPI000F4BC174|nr:recombinase family protein [Curtobacterium sp. PhB115]ROP74408.1 resolvase-like protein [Curtobacterium sp. PhB115]
MTKRIGYYRLSREDSKSMSIESQKKALRAHDPKMPIFGDEGISGERNLTDPKSEWSTKVRPLFLEDPANTQIVVYTYDRIGRKKGKVLSEVEDITDAGGSIFVVREGRTYDDAEEAAQSIELTFRSLTDETYRVEVSKKTRRTLDYLAQNEVPLGRKPELTDADLAKIRVLRERGLGYTAIGIVMAKVQKKDGKVINRSAETIKRALSGEYESREAYERRSREMRQRMAARAVLGLEPVGAES